MIARFVIDYRLWLQFDVKPYAREGHTLCDVPRKTQSYIMPKDPKLWELGIRNPCFSCGAYHPQLIVETIDVPLIEGFQRQELPRGRPFNHRVFNKLTPYL